MILWTICLALVAAPVAPTQAYRLAFLREPSDNVPVLPSTSTTTSTNIVTSTSLALSMAPLTTSTYSILAPVSLISSPASTSTESSTSISTPTSISISRVLASTFTSPASASLIPTSTSTSTSFSERLTPNSYTGPITTGVIGGVAGGTIIVAFLFWFFRSNRPSYSVAQQPPQLGGHKSPSGSSTQTTLVNPTLPQPSQDEPSPLPPLPTPAAKAAGVTRAPQPASHLASQNPYDPDDIPTTSTIPRIRRQATSCNKLPSTTETYWGQVGQYYHGVPEAR